VKLSFNQMKKTQPRSSPKKRPNVLQVLRRIANWPANSNSDPDVMGEALEEIQALASRTVLLLAPARRKNKPTAK
jgi:hypothetical protein